MESDRVLITGGAGFIGTHLAQRLVESGLKVIVYDNLSSNNRENVRALQNYARLEFVEGDILDEKLLQKSLTDCGTAVHLAANRDVRLGSLDTSLDFNQNLRGTRSVLECIRRTRSCTKLVFASTSTVYGEPKVIPTPEGYGPLKPLSLYGASKLGCEAMISAYSHLFGLTSVICRLSNVVGPRCDHGIIYDLMKKILTGSRKLEVLGDGTQRKSYLYVDDCIDALASFCGWRQKGLEIFNVGSLDAVEVRDIVAIIKKVASVGEEVAENYVDHGDGRGWPGDVKSMLLDCKKIMSLGWSSKLTSAEAVEATAQELFSNWRPWESPTAILASTSS